MPGKKSANTVIPICVPSLPLYALMATYTASTSVTRATRSDKVEKTSITDEMPFCNGSGRALYCFS